MESASGRISELLRHHDDLDKVSSLKQKLLKEKAVIDGQLKAGVQAQVAVMLKGMEKLSLAKSSIGRLRENSERVEQIREENEDSVANFSKINRLSRVLQNFEETQRFLDNFQSMGVQLKEIEGLMEKDGQFDPENTMPHFIMTHYKLSELRDVKDDAWYYAEKSTDDVRRTITKHFSSLDAVVGRFDETLFAIATELLEVIRAGNLSLVVRVAKIIDSEEKQDLAAEISKQMLESNAKNKTERVLAAIKNEKSSHREPRGYPSRFFKSIEDAVDETYTNCMEHYGFVPGRALSDDEEDLSDEMLDNLQWVFQDLGCAKFDLSPCVPSRWMIFEKYVSYYHRGCYKLVSAIMEREPPAATILHVLDFVREYYANMADLGVPKAKLDPPLLDGKEDSLYDDYLQLIVSKLREWRDNLATTEKENFINRTIPPESDGDGRLGMQGEVIMFSMINQQIDVAADSGQGRILAGCVMECAAILKERQADWEHVMKQQVQLQITDTAVDDTTSSVPGGLVEYLIALANDQIKGADYTEAISSRLSPAVSKKYRAQITSCLDQVCDGFIALAKACITGLISIIFSDLVQPYKEIFSTSAWRDKGRPIRQIVDTVREYVEDCAAQLNPVIFDVFSDDLLEETILKYLGALEHADKIKIPKGTERIKSDIEQLYVLFTGGIYAGNPEREAQVQANFKVFEHLFATLEAPESELLEEFHILREDFWDAPLDLYEKIVRARPQMESKRLKELMKLVRADALQSQAPPETGEPTFLSRFAK
ncbi:exocyst complex component Sec6p [Trichomonascus vanleenenianus]|uniref:SNARE-binding exocyst subunit SEC6 n=1 Tax=Trichomonascus vanleenenianus TaxID=2268995 RepID=UPI003ECB41D3